MERTYNLPPSIGFKVFKLNFGDDESGLRSRVDDERFTGVKTEGEGLVGGMRCFFLDHEEEMKLITI